MVFPSGLKALEYFARYLLECPPSVYTELYETRPHVRSWTDASGVDRIVAAVICVDGAWMYTFVQVSEQFLATLIPRKDNYFGFLEMLGPVLAFGTWPQYIGSSLWTNFIDNQGVLHGYLKGSSLSQELKAVIGHLWLEVTR